MCDHTCLPMMPRKMPVENLENVLIDTNIVKEAVDISVLNKLSYQDSLVIASAEKAKAELLFTEDLQAGQIIRGVRIVNPFCGL